MFRRYADDGASIADLARWLTGQGAPTRTGKNRWDRSVVRAMLRNPAYAGRAVFGKTMATSGTPRWIASPGCKAAVSKHVPADVLVEQRMELSVRISLGRPVKRMLQRSDSVASDSRQG